MTFLDLPRRLADPLTARYVILPAPYEKTVSYGTGTSKGPAAILRASRQVEWYDEEVQRETCAAGIHTAPALRFPGPNQRRHIAVIGRAVRRFLARDQFVFTLGGEHTITVGAVEPYLARFSRLSLLHLDAHADLRDSYRGSRLSHAAVMRRFVGRCPFVSVGVRSLCPEELAVIRQQHIPVWRARDLQRRGWQTAVVRQLTDTVYITIDVDSLDPALMPNTGTPEPGGIEWFELLDLLRLVCNRRRVVGADVTELAPRRGQHAPDYLVAKLVYRLLGYVEAAASGTRQRRRPQL